MCIRDRTLTIGWDLLTHIPRSEIKRIRDEYIDRYLPVAEEEGGSAEAAPDGEDG
mgnify:CR=1 FL=1